MPAPELAAAYTLQNFTVAGNTTDFTPATTDTFPASGTFVASGVYRISVALDTATTLVCRFTPTGGSATNFPLLNNVALTVNAPVSFILKLPDGASFTFRAGAACKVQFMVVEQVFGGII